MWKRSKIIAALITEESFVIKDKITYLSSEFEVGNSRNTEIILNDTTFMVTVWTSMIRIGE